MIRALRTRLRQGHRTSKKSLDVVQLPETFHGRLSVKPERCEDGCKACVQSCPTGAITSSPLSLDLGACVFCGACTDVCDSGAIEMSNDHRLAVRQRDDLRLGGDSYPLAGALDGHMRRVFGRSLKLRQVSAGGCSGCEAELAALGNVIFDLGRFGVQFVSSPRHADGIVITGPVTTNMLHALRETYTAVADPKIVIAVGACAISGGTFAGAAASGHGVPDDIPVDLYLPGCPPHPLTVMDGLLRLLKRL